MSCRGTTSDNLIWQHKASSDNAKSISSEPHEKVHSEPSVSEEGLDLVFRSVKQDYEGKYICAEKYNKSNSVSFDLVVVQPIDYGETPTTQMVKVWLKTGEAHFLFFDFSLNKPFTA